MAPAYMLRREPDPWLQRWPALHCYPPKCASGRARRDGGSEERLYFWEYVLLFAAHWPQLDAVGLNG